MKQCIVIYNPTSGKQRNEAWFQKFQQILLKYDYQSEIIRTEYAGHAKEIIASLPHTDLVLSVGGDGTLNEVMSGNLIRSEPLLLAHLPYGTANDIGKMYGLENICFKI